MCDIATFLLNRLSIGYYRQSVYGLVYSMKVRDPEGSTQYRSSAAKLLPLALFAIFSLIFSGTFAGLLQRWLLWDQSLAHGFLILAVFFYFCYHSLPWKVIDQTFQQQTLILVALSLSSLIWLFFHLAAISLLEQLMLLPLMFLTIAAIWGMATAWQLRMLLLFPLFALPVWDLLNDPLVQLSSFVAGSMVRQIHMPALIEGNSIFIPYGHIIIADGCSGLRYLVVSLAIAYVISYLNRYRLGTTLFTLFTAILIALIANWLRIFLLILIGYQTEMQSPLMHDHEWFGWLVFGILCLPAIYFAPVVRHPVRLTQAARLPQLTCLISAFFALAVGPLLTLIHVSCTENTLHPRLADVVVSSTTHLPIAIPRAAGGLHESGVVRNAKSLVFLQIDQYQRVGNDDKLVPYLPRLYDNERWMVIEQKTAERAPGIWTQFRSKNAANDVLQLQWLEVGDAITTTINRAKILQIPSLLKKKNHFAIITLQGECNHNSCEDVFNLILETFPAIQLQKDH